MVTGASDWTEQPLDRRKLIAVVHADVVGYSRLIGLDDSGTLDRMRSLRRDVIEPALARALQANAPARIELRIDPEAISPAATLEQIRKTASTAN